MNRADGSVARWNLSNLKSIASLCFSYLLVKFNNACRQVVKQQLPYLMPAQNKWILPIFCMQQLCLLLPVLHLFNKVAVKIIPCHRLLDRKPTFFKSAASQKSWVVDWWHAWAQTWLDGTGIDWFGTDVCISIEEKFSTDAASDAAQRKHNIGSFWEQACWSCS